MNYDETNLCNNPGRKKVIAKRGLKHKERVMNSTKSATSIVYAGCAAGSLLPPYVVYKATNMYNMRTLGEPQVRGTIPANLGGLICDVLRIGL